MDLGIFGETLDEWHLHILLAAIVVGEEEEQGVFEASVLARDFHDSADAMLHAGDHRGLRRHRPRAPFAVVSNLIPSTAASAPDHAGEITMVDLERLVFLTRMKQDSVP
jgi:hypothetical protein